MVIHTNERNILICLCPYKLMRISLSTHKFLLFNPWHYMLNVSTSATKTVNIFSIVVHKFPNYFEKCPLFGQILIAYLKYSRACLILLYKLCATMLSFNQIARSLLNNISGENVWLSFIFSVEMFSREK